MSEQSLPLLNSIRSCQICASELENGVRPVFQIDRAAKILIAGQAPGSKVHKTGVPFDDPSGDRLRTWLGMDRTKFYDAKLVAIVPMAFCYPGKGKSGDLPPRKECAEAWHDQVMELLDQIELTLVIGSYAIDYHFKNPSGQKRKVTLTEMVRQWKSYGNKIPLPHPSPRNNIWLKKNPWFEEELIPELREKVSDFF